MARGDVVGGHVRLARGEHRRSEARVVVGVAAARPRGHRHFADELGEQGALARAHRFLLALDLGPPVVAGHLTLPLKRGRPL